MLQHVASHCRYVIVDIPMYDKGGTRETAKEKKSRGKGSAVIYFGSHTAVCYFTRGHWPDKGFVF